MKQAPSPHPSDVAHAVAEAALARVSRSGLGDDEAQEHAEVLELVLAMLTDRQLDAVVAALKTRSAEYAELLAPLGAVRSRKRKKFHLQPVATR